MLNQREYFDGKRRRNYRIADDDTRVGGARFSADSRDDVAFGHAEIGYASPLNLPAEVKCISNTEYSLLSNLKF